MTAKFKSEKVQAGGEDHYENAATTFVQSDWNKKPDMIEDKVMHVEVILHRHRE